MTSLRVFDLAALDAGVGIADLRAVCSSIGFFYITNHGIDLNLIEAAAREMRALFALPLEERMAICLANSNCHHGYEPMKAQTLEEGMPPDLKEGFYIGNEITVDISTWAPTNGPPACRISAR